MFWWSRHYQEVPWGVRLIPFALKWSQEKSSVTATLLQRAESEPETCCDSDICRPDPPRPGFGPQWNNTPPSSHCGRGQRGVTERNVDRLKCDMKCVSNIKPREGVHIIQPILQLMNDVTFTFIIYPLDKYVRKRLKEIKPEKNQRCFSSLQQWTTFTFKI